MSNLRDTMVNANYICTEYNSGDPACDKSCKWVFRILMCKQIYTLTYNSI